jgi:hypothetical protein
MFHFGKSSKYNKVVAICTHFASKKISLILFSGMCNRATFLGTCISMCVTWASVTGERVTEACVTGESVTEVCVTRESVKGECEQRHVQLHCATGGSVTGECVTGESVREACVTDACVPWASVKGERVTEAYVTGGRVTEACECKQNMCNKGVLFTVVLLRYHVACNSMSCMVSYMAGERVGHKVYNTCATVSKCQHN